MTTRIENFRNLREIPGRLSQPAITVAEVDVVDYAWYGSRWDTNTKTVYFDVYCGCTAWKDLETGERVGSYHEIENLHMAYEKQRHHEALKLQILRSIQGDHDAT